MCERKKALFFVDEQDGIPICPDCKVQIGEGEDHCMNCALYESEQQIEKLHSLAIPIAQIIKPGRHRLSIVIDEETSDREKDALIAFYDEFKLTGEDEARK